MRGYCWACSKHHVHVSQCGAAAWCRALSSSSLHTARHHQFSEYLDHAVVNHLPAPAHADELHQLMHGVRGVAVFLVIDVLFLLVIFFNVFHDILVVIFVVVATVLAVRTAVSDIQVSVRRRGTLP